MADYTPVATGLDRLGTIEAYATPDQLKEARAYAAALQFGHGQQPVKHWTQGLSNMVASLMGGYQAGQTNRAENSRIQRESAAGIPDIGTPGAPPPVAKHADTGDGATPTAYAPGASLDDAYTNAVAKIESGGNPRNVTGSNRGLMQFGPEEERKYGITNWQDPDQQTAALAKERADHHARLVKALGRAPTPSELYLTHQQGPAGGPAILGGDPNEPAWKAIRPYYKSDRMAQLAITGNIPSDSPLKQVPVDRISKGTFAALWDAKYNRFAGRAGGGQPPAAPDGPSAGSALAFAGTPANPSGGPDQATSGWLKSLDAGVAPGANAEPGSPESMASALTPVGQRTPAAPPSGQLQPPGAGAPPPGVFPQRPIISREKLQTILSSPDSRVSQEQKALATKMYIEQFQPQQFKGEGGIWTMGTDGKPYFQSDIIESPVEGGGSKYTPRFKMNPRNGRYEEIPMDEAPAGTGARPVPGKPVTAAPEPIASPKDVGSVPSLGKGTLQKGLTKFAPDEATPVPDQADVPPGLRGVPPGEEAGGGPKPVSDASGMLGTPPPAFASADEGRVVSDAPPIGGPGDQVAEIPRKLRELSDFGVEQKVKEDEAKQYNQKDIESYQKELDATNEMGNKAATMTTQLELAKKMIENPKFKNGQGLFADPWLTMQRFKAAMGGDPEAASLAQAFTKVTSANILRDLGVELKGTGQVRVAEINLLEKAAASRYNTVAANRAVLDIAIRSHKQVEQLQQIANAYAKGIRFDAEGNPKMDKDGNYIIDPSRPTSRGLHDIKMQYLKNNPMYNKDEVDHYMHIFEQDSQHAQAEEKAGGKGLLAKPKAALPPETPVETAPTRPPPAGYNLRQQ